MAPIISPAAHEAAAHWQGDGFKFVSTRNEDDFNGNFLQKMLSKDNN